ncbi:hypothetical protein CFK41_15910 [Brachybacterium ginsengisoli]|uniref:Methylamine utilisation protein MauE domain-containing protein n=1 Tax=Brachybacterium ginsengisoli TaxID=1331682 RepID=A0A291H0V6_9MICO|nr:MauE/DoxX family redox-associated membrane protein [Brachybacterium ginsengisoli]ATG56097.1 hypothetical protein CFK41_15910 [Brachybacterium ginsengisoli]
MTSLLIAAPILLSLTLLTSGLAKLGDRRGVEDAMTSLRLPLRPFHRSIATVLPIAEFALAMILWVPSAPLQTMVAILIALLMVTYLGIIARALTWDEVVECSCFGTLASPSVTRTTLARNILLSFLAVLGVTAAASGLMERTLVQEPLSLLGFGAALLVTAVLVLLVRGGTSPQEQDSEELPAGSAPTDETEDEEELLDYERTAIPAAVLQQPDTRLITLRQLASHRAALLIFVSEGCGPCERVLDNAGDWTAALSDHLQVLFVFSRPVDQLRERTMQRVGDHVLHDLQFSARSALGGSTAPSAVLLGADGLLAGGPVDGASAVIDFVQELREQLELALEENAAGSPAE